MNACTPLIPHTHKVHAETECSKAMAEFARIEEQLSGVERYAMKYLEEANAEFAAAQLRLAEVRIQETNLSLVSLVFEVMAHNIAYIHMHTSPLCSQENIELAKKDWELSHLQSLREEEERLAEVEDEDVLLTYDRPETANKVILRWRPSTSTWEICSPTTNHDPLSHAETENEPKKESRRYGFCKRENAGEDSRRSSPRVQYKSDSKHTHKAVHMGHTANLSINTALDSVASANGTRLHSPTLQSKMDLNSSDHKLLESGCRDFKREHKTPPLSKKGIKAARQKSPDVASNHVVDDDSISSRTRQRSSHVNEEVTSPNHKYPTRHKFTGPNH